MFSAISGLGWEIEPGFFEFKRTQEDMCAFLWERLPQVFEVLELSFGNYQGRGISGAFRHKPHDPEMQARVRCLCPALAAFYQDDAQAGA